MDLNIHVNRTKCMGSGQCVHWAPGVFSQDDEAISIVVDPRGEPEEKIITAVNCCPVEAISLNIDGVQIETQALGAWSRGSLLDDPLVSLLDELSSDHVELNVSLMQIVKSFAADTTPGAQGHLHDDDRFTACLDSLLTHQQREETGAYPAIGDLTGASLVIAFARHHAKIRQAVDRFGRPAPDRASERAALMRLVRLVHHQIRLEETILYPLALGRLVSPSPPVGGGETHA